MIKDIIVNLEHRAPHDPACDYAISIAQAFNTHLIGVAFAYDPIFQATSWPSFRPTSSLR
jgi:hypothetical protein